MYVPNSLVPAHMLCARYNSLRQYWQQHQHHHRRRLEPLLPHFLCSISPDLCRGVGSSPDLIFNPCNSLTPSDSCMYGNSWIAFGETKKNLG